MRELADTGKSRDTIREQSWRRHDASWAVSSACGVRARAESRSSGRRATARGGRCRHQRRSCAGDTRCKDGCGCICVRACVVFDSWPGGRRTAKQ